MAKTKTLFICQTCGHASAKWLGKCPDCAEWNTFAEEVQMEEVRDDRPSLSTDRPQLLSHISVEKLPRVFTGDTEFDRLLGGGIVEGMAVLIGGEPGIGKSTLLLQVAGRISAQNTPCLYATSEESVNQLKLRASRLDVDSGTLYAVSETNIDRIEKHLASIDAKVVIIDSIQMVHSPEISSAPGSVSQIRQSAARLIYTCKKTGAAIFFVGHVTKGGAIAGPKVLEHIVDTVLYFEGDKYHNFRILRAFKNRFGSTNEIGVFEMTSSGLMPVDNPAGVFLDNGHENVPGRAITAGVEGSRPMLVEIQALSSRCSFGNPTRRVTGLDYNRFTMIAAVLEKRGGLFLGTEDIFVNAVGGVKLTEPACDLACALAVASSFKDKPLPAKTVSLGEVGLGGEIRPVNNIRMRVKEASRLSYNRIILPARNARDVEKSDGIELVPVRNLKQALELLG